MYDMLKSGATIWGVFIVFLAFGGYALLMFAAVVVAAIISVNLEDRKNRSKHIAQKRIVRKSKRKNNEKFVDIT